MVLLIPIIIMILFIYSKYFFFTQYLPLFNYFQRFPWGNGDQTLFHNPKLNATSKGYEVDE